MSRNIRKHFVVHVRPVKIQISPRICTVPLESSLCAFWKAKNAKFLYMATNTLIKLRGCAE